MDTMLKCEVEGCCMWKVGGMHQKKCEVEECCMWKVGGVHQKKGRQHWNEKQEHYIAVLSRNIRRGTKGYEAALEFASYGDSITMASPFEGVPIGKGIRSFDTIDRQKDLQ